MVSAAFVYGPFGEVVASVGAEEDDHLRRFNGKEADLESGLSYYGYRYYDSKSLSWTQADPLYLFAPDIGFDQPRLMTLYAFSLNNPIRYMDPDGLAANDNQYGVKPNGGTTIEVGCTDGTNDCFKEEERRKNKEFVADAEAEFRRWEEGFTIGGISVARTQGVFGFVEGTRQEAAVIKAGVSLSKQFGWKAPAAWLAANVAVVAVPAALSWLFGGGSAATLVQGAYGSVSAATLQSLAAAGGPTTLVLTRLSQSPVAGRALSVATGPGAAALTQAARGTGQLFQANIPTRLLMALEKAGLAFPSVTSMGGQVAKELRFSPQATRFIVDFFK